MSRGLLTPPTAMPVPPGKVGVCFATSGPGATNLVTGIATAYMDSSPIVFITCNVTEQTLGKDAFQEVDITGIAMPITKATYLVRDAQTIPDVMRQAFAVAATGRPAPVLIDFLKNVTFPSVEIDYEFVPWSRNRSCSSIQSLATSHELKAPEPNKGDIDTLVEMIAQSRRPLLICRRRCGPGPCPPAVPGVCREAGRSGGHHCYGGRRLPGRTSADDRDDWDARLSGIQCGVQ